MVALIERLHRLMLDVIKDEFERLGQIELTSVQALLLFNIGDEEVSAGELRSRGYYHGSNVSYNLKKLVEFGYLVSERSSVDRRAVRIRLTEKGREVRQTVQQLYNRHAEAVLTAGASEDSEFARLNDAMRQLERYWRNQIRFIY
ncbi:MAG: MarR family winged helix-turn-helix transcriptional regulator [Neomegalonema sp.]|nr:MarR family winged helix-turn-helix transcriptional regulator [Neomegalonema sp.]